MSKAIWSVIFIAAVAGCSSGVPADSSGTKGEEREGIVQRMFADLSANSSAAEMWKEIADRTILVDVKDMGNAVAAFSHDGGRERLALNPRYVRLATESDAKRVRVETYLIHESVHHRQYHDHPDAPEFPSCADWWLDEREAYAEQCRFAATVGASRSLKFCMEFGTSSFAPGMLDLLFQRDPRGPSCAGERQILEALP